MQGELQGDCFEGPTHNQISNINHNGFTNSPPLTQILPPILVLTVFGLTIAQVHIGNHNPVLSIIVDGAAIGLLLATCVLWYKTTKIIPTDTIQQKHLQAIEKRYCLYHFSEHFDSSSHANFCQLCQTHTSTFLPIKVV
jgi:L-lactate permease